MVYFFNAMFVNVSLSPWMVTDTFYPHLQGYNLSPKSADSAASSMTSNNCLLEVRTSLTVIRMLPVFLCLIGTRTSTTDKLFIGWFGPRGLAKIVFTVLVPDKCCRATIRSYWRPVGRFC
jgi:hypothetical protein